MDHVDLVLLLALRRVRLEVRNQEDRRYMRGICHVAQSLGITRGEEFLRLDEIMRKWPKSSGGRLYPVPSGDDRDAYDAYSDAMRGRHSFWPGAQPGDNPYGDLRMELLEFCIGYLEALK